VYVASSFIGSGTPPQAWGGHSQRSVTYECREHPHTRGEVSAGTYGGESIGGTPPRRWEDSYSSKAHTRGSGTPPLAWGRRLGRLAAKPDTGTPLWGWGRHRGAVSLFFDVRSIPTCMGRT
jgi:hypothetical protein